MCEGKIQERHYIIFDLLYLYLQDILHFAPFYFLQTVHVGRTIKGFSIERVSVVILQVSWCLQVSWFWCWCWCWPGRLALGSAGAGAGAGARTGPGELLLGRWRAQRCSSILPRWKLLTMENSRSSSSGEGSFSTAHYITYVNHILVNEAVVFFTNGFTNGNN